MGSRRGYAAVAVAGVAVVIGVGMAIRAASTSEATQVEREATTSEATPVERETTRIEPSELRGYPPLLLVWGDRSHASYSGTADLYLANADGTGVRLIRAWPDRFEDDRVYGVAAAHWSPNGKEIALMLRWWCGDPCGRLARVSSDGSRLRKVDVPGDILGAAWSSDWRAVLTTFDGSELWTTPMGGGKPGRILRSADGAYDADWSPRRRELVVTTARGLVRMTAAGKDMVALSRGANDVDPQWSPDGRAIAFIRQPACYYDAECSETTYVHVVGRGGQGLRRLASTADAASLLWSPDGRSILFTTDDSTEEADLYDINLVGATGEGRRVLTSGHGDDPIAWSPDGTKIFFTRQTRRERGRGDELWVMDADGGRQTRLPLYRRSWWVLSAEWRP